MARSKIVKPRKAAAKDAIPAVIAPKDINGDVTPTNELTTKESNSPRSTRKRTGDFNDFEDQPTAPDGQSKESTVDATSQPKEKSKVASGTDKTKPSSGKTPKANSGRTTKPSKTDGHPIVTEKTHPGGDTVEAEPAKGPKAQKKNSKTEGKKKVPEKAKPTPKEDPSKTSKGATSGAKGIESKDASNANNETHQIEAGDTAVAPATMKNKKDMKSKLISKQAKDAPEAEPEEDTTTTKSAASKSGKEAKDPKEAQGKASDPAPAEETAIIAPEEAMDEAPFKKLVKRERTKIPSVKASAEKAEAERKAAAAASRKEAKAKREEKASKAKGSESTPKKNQEIRDSSTAPSAPADNPPTKALAGKKRKDGPESADAKTSSGPSGKKQKKSTSTALDTAKKAVGDFVNSGIEAAAQGVNAVKEFASGMENKSIADDITAVAEGAVEEKSKNKRATKAAKPSDEKSKKGKGKAKADAEEADTPADEDVAFDDESGEDDFEEGDDQTAALIKGFESDGDEAEPSGSAGFEEGAEVPQIPKKKDISKKLKAAKDDSDGPGVIYVGYVLTPTSIPKLPPLNPSKHILILLHRRIPHGFYEPQMRAYFSQFGPILRLRLSRNRTTGASKHYAFIEFASAAVSRIVAETMDTYLMFGHILKCKTVAPEQVHENLWKGANKRFKSVPWSRIEGRRMEKAVGREAWEKRVKAEQKRRKVKGGKLKEVGYEFESTGLKKVGEVPVREGKKAEEETVEEEKTLVVTEAGAGGRTVLEEEIMTKRVRKGTAKRQAMEEEGGGPLKEVVKKAKKAKKDVST
ncbi:MAG: hypothetical protein L6R37_004270 [Teloschistes peruensis]|nr:MAG: hypothetical protein L6R37_004270 [Teloschistes peruensis]